MFRRRHNARSYGRPYQKFTLQLTAEGLRQQCSGAGRFLGGAPSQAPLSNGSEPNGGAAGDWGFDVLGPERLVPIASTRQALVCYRVFAHDAVDSPRQRASSRWSRGAPVDASR